MCALDVASHDSEFDVCLVIVPVVGGDIAECQTLQTISAKTFCAYGIDCCPLIPSVSYWYSMVSEYLVVLSSLK